MSTIETHNAFHDILDSLKSWNKARADDNRFFIAVYVAAIIPWAFLTAFDSIDGRWRPIRKLYLQTFVQFIFILISIALLLWYVIVQFIADDVKEAMSSVAVLLAALFPAIRVYRRVWIIFATRSFAKIIQTMPNLTFCECQLYIVYNQLSDHIYNDPTPEHFNSSHCFENDRPGDEVLRFGETWSTIYVWNCLLARCRRLSLMLSTKPLSTDFAAGKLDALIEAPGYLHAFSISRYELRAVDSFSASEPAEDLLTRIAWIYGNAFVDPHTHHSSPNLKIIHLDLLVQVGYAMWVETRQNIAVLGGYRATGITDVEHVTLDSKVEFKHMSGKYSWFVP